MSRSARLIGIWGLVLGVSLVRAGGPDRGGYRWIDSDTTGGPVFDWVDISSSGTRVALGDDDNQGPFALGFGFDFYGVQRESVRVCSNGWLSFTSESHQFHHFPIPDTRDPNSLLAPLWADLDPSQGGSVLYFADTSHDRFVVSWVGVPLHGTSDSCTFQTVLGPSDTILFQYLRVPYGDSSSVGIENDSGSTGLEYVRDGEPEPNRLHDSLTIRFYRLQHDACPRVILRPMEQVLAGESITPLVEVWNAGLSPASFPVSLKVGEDYREQLMVNDLPALRDTLLQFPVWVPEAETCVVELVTALAGDECPANDTLRAEVAGSYVGELRYDDGVPDTWFLKNGSPTSDWAGAARFAVPYSRYRVLGAKVFVADTMPFARVLVCPDSSGAPMLGSPYIEAESVAAAQPETWLDVPSDTQVDNSGDLWLVAFWPRRATGPRIGEDRNVPIDGRSYYGSPTVRWFSYTAGDVLGRIRIDGRSGVAEVHAPDARRLTSCVSPNPFSRTTVLRMEPASNPRIRDAAGRVVRGLRVPEAGSVVWDGRSDSGALLPPGAYFVMAGAPAVVTRVLLVR